MTKNIMESTVPGAPGNLVDRPIRDGLMGVDGEGAHIVGGSCTACGFVTLGVREICPECWAEGTMQDVPIGRSGRLYTYTVIHQLPPGYDAPFAVGYVDLEDGIRVFAHIENRPECLLVDRRLRLTLAPLRRDDDGDWLSGPLYTAEEDEVAG